jgi:hypothetical protein
VLNDDELLEQLWKRAESKPRVFPEGRNSVRSFMTAIGIGWSKCLAVANFPAKEARKLFRKYCPAGGLIYDPSAGFGSRMAAALLGGFGYVATDPNKDLFPLLYQFHDFLLNSGYVLQDQKFHIFCQGSEVNIPQLHGAVDFVFTSPPYFDLEEYSDDTAASTRNYRNFKAWGREYVVPTVLNIKSYLKPGACVAINIKNLPGCALYDCWRKVFVAVKGFKELEPDVVSIPPRYYRKGKGVTLEDKIKNYFACTDSELCMVFQKE